VITVGCVGGLTLDWVRNSVSVTGPTAGGNALYSGVGAWLAGARPALCAVAGQDFPRPILDGLARNGFDLDPLRHIDGRSFRVLLDDSGTRRAVSYLEPCGHNDTLDPVAQQISADWDIAHLAAIPTSSQQRLAAALGAAAVPYTLDTIFIPGEIEPAGDDLIDLAAMSQCFLPSADELDVLWPMDSHVERLAELFRHISRPIVETRGSCGSLGFDGTRIIRVPSFRTVVRDTTGAGDAYGGAFAAACAQGCGLGDAMALAAAAASVVIEAPGAEHVLESANRTTVQRRAHHLRTITTEEQMRVIER
jgi:sugar/nucleoside kinase (ribokinase family)